MDHVMLMFALISHKSFEKIFIFLNQDMDSLDF